MAVYVDDAIATDRYGPTEHTARLDIASGDPARVAHGERWLAAVARCRELPPP